MKRYRLNLLVPLVLAAFILIAGGCITVNIPQSGGQQSAAVVQPVINSFSVSPTSITAGGSATLSWQVTGADKVNISPGIGDVAPVGNRSILPSATTTYTLKATNVAGWRSKSITVTVTPIKIFKPVIPNLPLAQFEDKTWVLEKYGQTGSLQNAIAGKEVNARFDSSTGKVSGSAGCNSYSASYSRNGNKLTVSSLTSTMMLCSMPAGIMQQEGEYKNALGGAESCSIIGSKLEINCTLGRLMVFHPK